VHACDVLFLDEDGESIASAMLDAILACPTDARKRLLILCGWWSRGDRRWKKAFGILCGWWSKVGELGLVG
jgi:hypothetical protein